MKPLPSRRTLGKQNLLAAAVFAALAAPATAWSQACSHLGGPVQCPTNPGTGLPLPPGSSSLAFVPGGTNWQIFGDGTVFIPLTTFAPFVAPAPPVIGVSGGGTGIPVLPGGIPTTAGGQLALVGPVNQGAIGINLSSSKDHFEKALIKANDALYADQISPSVAPLVNPVGSQYIYSYFDDRNGDLQSSEIVQVPGYAAGGMFFGADPANPIPLNSLNAIDPDLSNPKTHEVVLGITQQVGRDTSVGVNLTTRRRFNDTWAVPMVQDAAGNVRPMAAEGWQSISGSSPGVEPQPAAAGPAPDFKPVAGLAPRANYSEQFLGAEMVMQKRFSDRWSFAPNLGLSKWTEAFNNSAAWATAPTVKTFVVPQVIEKVGQTVERPKVGQTVVRSTRYTFDTFAVTDNSGGAQSGGSAPGLDLFIFEQGTGSPCAGAACGQQVGGADRKMNVRIDDLLEKSGDKAVVLGFGVVVVGGADPNNVALQGFVVNSHSSAFDLSVFGFDPVPLAAADGGSAAPAVHQPVQLTVPAAVVGPLTVSQVSPQPAVAPSNPVVKPAAPEPAMSPEAHAQQEAAQSIVRGLANSDPNKQRVAREALKIANPETKRLVGQIMASNRLAVSQARSDAANYNAEAARSTAPGVGGGSR